jgi:hypothetical protein
MRRYDVIIRVNVNKDGAPMPPRAVVKYRNEHGTIRPVFKGKPCESFEQATMQALKEFYKHNAARMAGQAQKEAAAKSEG